MSGERIDRSGWPSNLAQFHLEGTGGLSVRIVRSDDYQLIGLIISTGNALFLSSFLPNELPVVEAQGIQPAVVSESRLNRDKLKKALCSLP